MKIKVHPSFWLYLSSMALLSSPTQCLAACAALGVHEASHCAVAAMVSERFSEMDITPFGGVMTFERGHTSAKGLKGMAVAAAGPLGNYLAIVLLSAAGQRWFAQSPGMLSPFITANTAMMLLNLLPALPLDGGRMLFCAGYYAFSVSRLAAILSALGAVLGAGFICLAFYGMRITDKLNVSTMIVGAYLIAYALGSRKALLSENLYAVVQERLGRKRETTPLSLYSVPADTPLYALLTPIDRARCAAFVFEREGIRRIVGEKEVLLNLLENPNAQIADAAAGHELYKTV